MNQLWHKTLLCLLMAQFVGLGILFPLHTVSAHLSIAIQGLSFFFGGLGLLALVSVALRKDWALWAVLAATSFKLTIDLYAWATQVDRGVLLWLGVTINIAIIGIAFKTRQPVRAEVTALQKIFYASVLVLAFLIGLWGLFFPAQSLQVLPFAVPPLHARFLGSMYLSGATFMALNILASRWSEVRVVTPMITVWTGMLGFISLFYLDAFNWQRIQVWIWFFAYIGFPLVAAWIAWYQRSQTEHPSRSPMAPTLRTYLWVQGGLVTTLALCLLFAPGAMAPLWPWKITPLLAHIYSAPFLSYGLGSLYALRQKSWLEVRILVYATLVFAAAVLAASFIHIGLFDFKRIAPWLWFGGFALSTIALGLFGAVPKLRSQRPQF
ncbi:MAG TPA: hypothetical protein V6D19_20655 [Stenomitos sp.]